MRWPLWQAPKAVAYRFSQCIPTVESRKNHRHSGGKRVRMHLSTFRYRAEIYEKAKLL